MALSAEGKANRKCNRPNEIEAWLVSLSDEWKWNDGDAFPCGSAKKRYDNNQRSTQLGVIHCHVE